MVTGEHKRKVGISKYACKKGKGQRKGCKEEEMRVNKASKIFYGSAIVLLSVIVVLIRKTSLLTPIWWCLGIGTVFGIIGGLIGGLVEKKLISMHIFRTIFFTCLWCGILLEILVIWFSIDYTDKH